MNRGSRAASLALVSLTTLLLEARAGACSGPGAEDAIDASFRVALLCLLASLVVLLASLTPPVRRRVRRTGVRVALAGVLLHPAVWMNAYGGDCGYGMRSASLVFTALMFAGFAALLWRGRTES